MGGEDNVTRRCLAICRPSGSKRRSGPSTRATHSARPRAGSTSSSSTSSRAARTATVTYHVRVDGNGVTIRRGEAPDPTVVFTEDYAHRRRHRPRRPVRPGRVHRPAASGCTAICRRLVEQSDAFEWHRGRARRFASRDLILIPCPSCPSCRRTPNASTIAMPAARSSGSRPLTFTALKTAVPPAADAHGRDLVGVQPPRQAPAARLRRADFRRAPDAGRPAQGGAGRASSRRSRRRAWPAGCSPTDARSS